MPVSIKASATASVASDTSVELPALSTTPIASDTSVPQSAFADDVLILLFVSVTDAQVDSVADTVGLTWFNRASVDLGGPTDFELWYAVSTVSLVDSVITVTLSDMTAATASAIAVSGTDISAPFDINPLLPMSGLATEQLVDTSAENTVVFGGYRFATEEFPTAGGDFATITGEGFLLTEFQSFSSAQTALTVAVNDGVADIDAGIADAIVVLPDDFQPLDQGVANEPVKIPLTGTIQFILADFEADNGVVVEAEYDDDGELVTPSSFYVYEEMKGDVLYRIVAENPVIRDDLVIFTLRDAEQIS